MPDHEQEADAIAASADPATFENTIVALERSGQILSRVTQVFNHLKGADTNPEIQAIERTMAPRLSRGRAYDRRGCYPGARRRRLRPITPPRTRAVLRHEPDSLERNRAIEEVRLLGKANWKRSQHYGRRSLAEAARHRLKAAFGPGLRSRLWPNQQQEALLRAHVLNSWLTPKRLS